MNSKTVLLFTLLIMLPSAMLGARFIVPVEGAPGIIEVGPGESIQAAIDAADPGDIIQVASGTYPENLIVNRSLMLVGEDSSTTIIDGYGIGIVVRVDASDVEIRGFTIQNGGDFPESGIRVGSYVRNTIRNCIVRNNAFGIELQGSNESLVVGNTIMNNSWAGIHVKASSNNVIHDNIITNNSIGVWITSESSLLNTFYHNNFIDNLNQNHAQDFALTTNWDNGAEGNYWSDYTGADDGSGNRTAGDGVGDTLLPHKDVDWYPLIEPWSQIRVFYAGTWNGVTYYVTISSNSIVATESFNFSVGLMRISFNVTSGASGFCNVTIPQELLDGVFKVLIDGEQIPTFFIRVTPTHYSLYFTYSQGTHHVEVHGTTVIPEFPGSVPLPMFLVALAIVLVFIRRRSKRCSNKLLRLVEVKTV